ncbi:MAG TPA: flagellar basal body P-ring protein FlgI [Candidatus Binataceae bacterium]|nr:flagellar basal body P-ring protein FlgI [Candidatus Binataceae bacterium]
MRSASELERLAMVFCVLLLLFVFDAALGWAQYRDDLPSRALPPPQGLDHVQVMAPGGGLLGFQHGMGGNYVPLATLAHIHGVRVNHLIGHGLVVGLQNTGDSQQTLFSIAFLLNVLRHESITLPNRLNPSNIQVRNLAAVMVTADMPPFARVGARIDSLVSAMGDARSLQGGTLLMTPLRGADGRVYALAQGPLSIEGYFASASGGASERKNFQTAGQIPGGATVEREVLNDFAHQRKLEIDLDDPNAEVAMRAASAITTRFRDAQAAVMDPGTLQVMLPDWLSPVAFAASMQRIEVAAGESDRVIMDERTGTIVVGGEVTVGKAAVSHGNLTVTIEPKLIASQPHSFSRRGKTVALKTANIKVDQEPGEFFMMPQGASVEQIAETLNAVGTKPGDVIAIFEGLRAAGALRGEVIIR